MPYNFVADSIYTNKLCSRLPSSEVALLDKTRPFCIFGSLWGLGSVTPLILCSLERLPISVN